MDVASFFLSFGSASSVFPLLSLLDNNDIFSDNNNGNIYGVFDICSNGWPSAGESGEGDAVLALMHMNDALAPNSHRTQGQCVCRAGLKGTALSEYPHARTLPRACKSIPLGP